MRMRMMSCTGKIDNYFIDLVEVGVGAVIDYAMGNFAHYQGGSDGQYVEGTAGDEWLCGGFAARSGQEAGETRSRGPRRAAEGRRQDHRVQGDEEGSRGADRQHRS